MKYRQRTSAWRDRHAEAGEYLKKDRDCFFSNPANISEIITRLQCGHAKALRDLAREIRAKGIYSRKTALCQVELALLKRVRLAHAPTATWMSFVRGTVGLGWLKDDRKAA
jgi:hypothetical protein